MAAEDAGGSGDLAILVNTEMIILKGAVKAAASAGSVTGKVVNKALLSPFRLIQFCMKLHKQHIISTSDFKSFTQFMKACDGDYIIANLPTRDPEQLDKLMDSMTEVGITYCLLPDLDIQDSCQQIAIRGKDVAKWQALYESYVTNQLDLGGPLDFEELKALTSGNYKIKSLALGDASEDNEQLEQFLDILDERGVNYSVLPDLKYGDNHIQIAVANQSLQQFAAAIKAYLEEFPDAAKNLVEDITEQEYFDSGRMSEEDYMKTASPEIKEKTDPKNWQKGKNLNAQSFEQALAGKEVDRYEALKNRPGLIERYIPSQRVAARREDEIALQTGDREYVRIQEALSVDNGKGFIIFLDPEKNYNVYRPDEKGILHGVRIGPMNHFGWTMHPIFCNHFQSVNWTQLGNNQPQSKTFADSFSQLGCKFGFGPILLRGFVEIDQPGDTFIRPKGFEKGMIAVNGFLLGRYYNSAGPQKTLYLPGPLLKKGTNEIILLELEQMEVPSLLLEKEPDLG